MVAPMVAAAGIGAVGSLFSGIAGGKGAKRAAKYQYKAAKKAIAEQQRQYDQTRADFEPFREAGLEGLGGLTTLLGLNGADAQMAAITGLKESPMFQSLYRTGEEAVLQNASATGGIRGGNTQSGLYLMGEDTLARTLDRQLTNLGGLVGVGQGATGSVANFGAQKANAVSDAYGRAGDAMASGALAQAGIMSRMFQNLGHFGGMMVNPNGGGGGF